MATTQSEMGGIRIFEDFVGAEWEVENTDESKHVGPFKVVGDAIGDTDSGIDINESDPCLNGVAHFVTGNTADDDHIGLVTSKMFNVAKMAPIVAEIRVQFADLDNFEFYFGLSGENAHDQGLESDLIHGATEALTLTEDDICGFFFSDDLSEDEMWHCVYNGGTTTGETDSTEVESGIDAVAAEYNILRLEIDPNGTARYLIDGVLKKTVTGAVSTTEDLALVAIIEQKTYGTGTEDCDVDYILATANRDWTV